MLTILYHYKEQQISHSEQFCWCLGRQMDVFKLQEKNEYLKNGQYLYHQKFLHVLFYHIIESCTSFYYSSTNQVLKQYIKRPDAKTEILAKLSNSGIEVRIALSIKYYVFYSPSGITEIEGLFYLQICLGELILLVKARYPSIRPQTKQLFNSC